MNLRPKHVLLEGVTGSRAHGLATPSSDTDIKGVFAAPTRDLFRFVKPEQEVRYSHTDTSFKEVDRFLHLAFKSNPTVLEVLWLPEFLQLSPWGEKLVANREQFICQTDVRNAYIGYSNSQWKQALERAGKGFDPDAQLAPRVVKPLRHAFLYLDQGFGLYTTGQLAVTAPDRDWYLDVLPTLTLNQILPMIEERRQAFDAADSPLPEKPNLELVEELLIGIRMDPAHHG